MDRQNLYMKSLRTLEHNLLFGIGDEIKEPPAKLNTIAPKLHSALMESEKMYEKYKIVNNLNKSHISQRISTFSLILDLHLLVSFINEYRLIQWECIQKVGARVGWYFLQRCLMVMCQL